MHQTVRRTIVLAAISGSFIFGSPSANAQGAPDKAGSSAGYDLPQKLSLPKIATDVLPNGLHVYYTKSSEVPLVEFAVVIRSGTNGETPARAGLANLLRVTLLNSMSKTPLSRINADLSALGSTLTSSTDYDCTQFSIKSLARNFLRSADILSGICLNPEWTKQSFDESRTAIQQSLVRLRESQASRASKAFLAAMFGETHYLARNQFGGIATLDSITMGDIQEYYHVNYRPENAALVIVGDLDYAAVRPLLVDRFGAWSASSAPTLVAPAEKPHPHKSAVIVNDTAAAFVQLRIAWPTGGRAAADAPAAMLASQILGGSPDALLGEALWKNEKLSPNFFSTYSAFMKDGYVVMFGSIPAPLLDTALARMQSCAGKLRDGGFDDALLGTGRRQLLGNNIAEFETDAKMLAKVCDIAAYDLPPAYYEQLYSALMRVTKDDIARYSARVLDPQRCTIAAYGNADYIAPALRRAFGGEIKLKIEN